MKIFLIFILLVCPQVSAQRADFFKEDITFRLDKNHLKVEGYYWFLNNSDKSLNSDIFYPFPNYSDEKVDSIQVFNISSGQELKFQSEGKHGVSFFLPIYSHDTTLIKVCYRQEIKGDSTRYILTTTKGWGKPLNNAEYKLIIQDTLSIKSFSYQPDKSYSIQNQKIYYWKMENFMPSKDMIFYF